MKKQLKGGFTLIELLVVIGIIAILAATLLAALSSGGDAARNAKCQTNMKNLAAACQTYGMAEGYYPLAGSVEKMDFSYRSGSNKMEGRYYELTGWISWFSNGAYNGYPAQHMSAQNWFTSAYTENMEEQHYALTNGVLFKYLSGNRNVYICPEHKRKFPQSTPVWSYVMSGYFEYDNSYGGNMPRGKHYHGKRYLSVDRAERRLLFAELGWEDLGQNPPAASGAPGRENDCTLQFEDKYKEMIGFNHKSGKRDRFANVIFADGHVERLAWPRMGLSSGDLEKLTKWLVNGNDITFDGQRYDCPTGDN